MILKEIKCVHCGQWTPGNHSNCQSCGGLTDYRIIDLKERKHLADVEDKRRKKNESKLEKLIRKLESSEHPFVCASFHVLNIIWIVYSALIAFVIWFSAIFSG
jgi:hypothetical protein